VAGDPYPAAEVVGDERHQHHGVEHKSSGRRPDALVAVGDAQGVRAEPQRRAQVRAPDLRALPTHQAQHQQGGRAGDETHARQQARVEQVLLHDVPGDERVGSK